MYWRYDKERKTVNTLVYGGDTWAMKYDTRYWDVLPSAKGIIGREVPYLKTVCWVEINIAAENCIPMGFKYRLYLLHGLMEKSVMKN